MSKGEQNRIAILYHNNRKQEAVVAVAIAKRQYLTADHTQGQSPKLALFNPAQKPNLTEISGLKVQSDKSVPLNHIRIASAIVEVLNV